MAAVSRTVAVEGLVDKAVAKKMVSYIGASCLRVCGLKGRDQIRRKIAGYNNAARLAPWLVLVDLDRCQCAPKLKGKWLPAPTPYMCFRVAVRTIEAWLLADAKNFARFFNIPERLLPSHPKSVSDPKHLIVTLAKQSRKRDIREGLVPADSSGVVGPRYTTLLSEFASAFGDIRAACRRSPSLQRAVRCLKTVLGAYGRST
ncbi:MAG: DUF4276 family protein [Armatimonadetes bacterium]|nr:DUF4276 family protein [Armatimonadota bacterium]MDW8122990.1 hypothetical protein [Armatimonadota bacterium]